MNEVVYFKRTIRGDVRNSVSSLFKTIIMKLRRPKKLAARLAGRIADYEKSVRTAKAGTEKQFTKPGSNKK